MAGPLFPGFVDFRNEGSRFRLRNPFCGLPKGTGRGGRCTGKRQCPEPPFSASPGASRHSHRSRPRRAFPVTRPVPASPGAPRHSSRPRPRGVWRLGLSVPTRVMRPWASVDNASGFRSPYVTSGFRSGIRKKRSRPSGRSGFRLSVVELPDTVSRFPGFTCRFRSSGIRPCGPPVCRRCCGRRPPRRRASTPAAVSSRACGTPSTR